MSRIHSVPKPSGIKDANISRSLMAMRAALIQLQKDAITDGSSFLTYNDIPQIVGASTTAIAAFIQNGYSYVEMWENTDTLAENWLDTELGSGTLTIESGQGVSGGKVAQAVGETWYALKNNIPYVPEWTYKLTVRFRRTAASTNSQEFLYAGVVGVASDGVTLINVNGVNSHSSQHYLTASGFDVSTVTIGEWTYLKGYFKGHGTPVTPANSPQSPTPLKENVSYIRPMFIMNYNDGDGTQQIDFVSVEVIDTAGTAELIDDAYHAQTANWSQVTDDNGERPEDGATRNRVFRQTLPPSGAVSRTGDFWFDTDDDNHPYWYDGSSWIDIQDLKVQQALADAANAQSTADGKIVAFYQDAQPTGGSEGDIWFDTDDGNTIYIFKTGSWQIAQDTDIPAAIAAAQNAQTTADGKALVHYQTAAPTGKTTNDIGDLWVDTDDNNKLWAWNGTAWILAQDWYAANLAAQNAQTTADQALADAAQALSDAASAQSTADGKIETFWQTTAPASASLGDLWFDTDDGNRVYRWNGSAWEDAQDSEIATAIAAAQNAQTTADGKAEVFYQTTAPTGVDTGDLWVDTDDNNRLYVYDGTQWVLAQDWYAANQAAQNAQSLADAIDIRLDASVKYQATQPGSAAIGDVWVNSTTGQMYVYRSTGWQSVAPSVQFNSGNITTFFANAAIGNAQIANLAVDKLLAGTIATNGIYLTSTRFHLDGINERIDIQDGSSTLRVRIGSLGTDYGAEFYDSSGFKYLKANGEGLFAPASGVDQGDGTVYRNIARGLDRGSARDGDVITFASAWADIPAVDIVGGGLSYSAALTGNQVQDFKAVNVSTTGFTVSAKLKELSGAPVLHTDTGSTTAGSLDHEMHKSQSAEAFDDQYTFQYDVTVRNEWDSESGFWLPGHVSVGIYTNDGGGWVKRATVGYSGGVASSSTTKANQTYTVVVDGLTNHGGREFGINIESESIAGGSLVFDNVKYTTATAASSTSATPSGAPDVRYIVLGGE